MVKPCGRTTTEKKFITQAFWKVL